MKKILLFLCAALLSISTVEARPHGWGHHHGGYWRPAYHHSVHRHHRGGDVVAGIIAGAVGASIINYAFRPQMQVTTNYVPTVYTPPVAVTPIASAPVVSAPVVSVPTVSSTVVSTTTYSQPCYTTTNIVTGATTTQCNSTIIMNP